MRETQTDEGQESSGWLTRLTHAHTDTKVRVEREAAKVVIYGSITTLFEEEVSEAVDNTGWWAWWKK